MTSQSGEPLPVIPVFLIHFDAPDWCRSAVQSLQSSVGVVPAIVVIDNGGRALPQLDDCYVVKTARNGGYTGGANRALEVWAERFAESDVAVIASHDLHVEPDCLARLHDALMSERHLGVVGPVFVSSPRSTGGDWRPWHRSQSFDPAVEASAAPVVRSWTSGTCLMMRRECVGVVGTFDERFGSYIEDVDYCLRVGDAGWKVAVVPGAHAHGLGSSSSLSYDLIARNRMLLLRKREGVRGVLVGVVEAAARIPGLILRAVFRPGENRSAYLNEARSLARAALAVGRRSSKWAAPEVDP